MQRDWEESGPPNELAQWSASEEGASTRHSDEKRSLLTPKSSEFGEGDGHRAVSVQCQREVANSCCPTYHLCGLSFLVCEVGLIIST